MRVLKFTVYDVGTAECRVYGATMRISPATVDFTTAKSATRLFLV